MHRWELGWQEIPHEGAFGDIVWSDPEEIESWAVSPRGAGWLFGEQPTKHFNRGEPRIFESI